MKTNKVLLGIVLAVLFAFAGLGASSDYTIITFEVTESVSISVAETSPCTQTNFACRYPTGTGTEINITDTSGSSCQNQTSPAITVSNDGTVPVNVSFYLNSSITGVTLKAYVGSYNYASATAITTTQQALITNLGVGSSSEVWMWCDFSNFNSGLAGSDTRKIVYNATRY